MIKKCLWWIIGFIVTILMPPLVVTGITYAAFPTIKLSFKQIFWLVIIWWLSLNYITINIENAIKNKKGE